LFSHIVPVYDITHEGEERLSAVLLLECGYNVVCCKDDLIMFQTTDNGFQPFDIPVYSFLYCQKKIGTLPGRDDRGTRFPIPFLSE
jgi:hypothetical protein